MLLLLLLLLNPFIVASTSNAMFWLAPTSNTDGSLLASSDIKGYNIYRSASCSSALQNYASVDAPATTFVDPSPLQGTNCYCVTALNQQLKEGMCSNMLAFPVPSQPQNLH